MGARGWRAERLLESVREELSNLLEYEVNDPRIAFAIITDVRLSPDLHTVLVYVRLPGDENENKDSLKALKAAQGFIRYELGQRLGLKHVPNVDFHLDLSEKSGQLLDDLLRREQAGQE